jgi:hypothetical protein
MGESQKMVLAKIAIMRIIIITIAIIISTFIYKPQESSNGNFASKSSFPG